MTRNIALTLALLGALALAGCGLTAVGQGEEIVVRAGERGDKMYFEPKHIVVQAGATVTFVIRNEGTQDHEFESAEEGEAGIEEIIVPPGRTRRVVWTAPSEPAVYPVYCDLPGHREAGMELTLEVVAATPTP
ncbi:MAG TPA: cupredoxin domain-containing protein [Dehalococcoidia bacterium]|nr:cupredoxin domain-containing protein [Dehalococcoidia bacterium]